MAAAATDKYRKVARRWVGQIGAGGVNDGSTTTIPLSSATNLPTDTAVTLVIDRVDANGVTTASMEETITGVVSGSNIIDAIRGTEGTAQAHDAGAVVELLFTAKGWNDFIDGTLAEHNQDGTHKAMTGASLTSPKITTGINDANNNELFKVTATASAVNEFTVANAATAGKPTLSATGGDTDISINIVPKGTGTVQAGGVVIPTISSTATFTNKRITPRVVTETNYTTDTGTSLNCDTTDRFIVTAQAGALKLNNPSGNATDGQTLWVSITGTGARALTYDTQFEASAAVALPTTTVTTNRLDMGFVFISATTKWRIVASA